MRTTPLDIFCTILIQYDPTSSAFATLAIVATLNVIAHPVTTQTKRRKRRKTILVTQFFLFFWEVHVFLILLLKRDERTKHGPRFDRVSHD